MPYSSTFFGLNTALRGLLAQQAAMDVTGHNIANINTEGYSRQRAELVQTDPHMYPAMNMTSPSQFGSGVEVRMIERLRDGYIDSNLRNQFGNRSQSETLVGGLSQVENAFNELGDNGLAALMQNYFTALNKVSQHADSMSARQEFAQAAQALTDGFNALGSELTAIQAQSDARLNQTVTDINAISTSIAALNTQIRDAVGLGQQPNDLLDERDRLMDDLSKLINYTSTLNPDSTVTISFGTTAPTFPILLVDPLGAGTNPITRADLDTAFSNVPPDLTAGTAAGDEALWAPGGYIDTYITNIDSMIADFVTDMNAQHALGFDLNGNAGGDIFDAGFTSIINGDFRLDPLNNILTNPDLIAAAGAGPGAIADGDNANAMWALRNVIQGAPLNTTWEQYYTGVYTQVGVDHAAALQNYSNRAMIVQTLESRRAEVSGVSLDEEMSNMLRFQHAYGASARVMTAIDESLDILINRMGRVGL